MTRRSTVLLVLFVVAGAVAACGNDDENGRLERPEDASTASSEQLSSTGTPEQRVPSSGPQDTGVVSPEGDPEVEPSTEDTPPPELTSQAICDRIPADVVAEALGVESVTAAPGGSSGTPQCAYRFEGADGLPTNATIAALRAEADLGGREGGDAYRYTVELNRGAAEDTDVTETALEHGDEAVLLESEGLRFAIVRHGRRIVTVLVPAGAAGHDATAALAAKTAALAP